MRKLILAGFASLFALSAHAAPPDWHLVYSEQNRQTYIDNTSGLETDSTIIHHDVKIWYAFGKEKVEIVSYDIDCTKGLMRKEGKRVWDQLDKSWPEAPYTLKADEGKWLHPYDHSLIEVYNVVCIGGD
jgi:hypothetical protein